MSGFEIPIALAVAGAATSAAGAAQQNRAVKKSMDAAAKNAEVTRKQLGDATMLDIKKTQQESGRVRGRLRTAAAESGVDFTGSYASFDRQALIDEATNLAIIRQNEYNQTLRINSGLAAEFASLESRGQNALLSGIQGAISGASTGLSIQNAIGTGDGASPADIPDPTTTVGGSGGLPSFAPTFDGTRLA